MLCVFVFFKQKTAYEMRISDWSSDVCSSDLGAGTLSISNEFVDDKLIRDAHARDLQLFVYTVNDLDEMRRLRSLGVDGIFTDYPDRALQILRSRTGKTKRHVITDVAFCLKRDALRSDERRVGKEGVSTLNIRW